MVRKNTCGHFEMASRLVTAFAAVTLTLGLIAPFVIAGEGEPPPVHNLMQELEGDYSGYSEQDSEDGPRFGFSMAMYGDTLAVGAPNARSGPAGIPTGIVFIFRLQGGQWQLQQRLSHNFSNVRECGFAVALDAYNLLVGCPGAGLGGLDNIGHARRYTRASPAALFELDGTLHGSQGNQAGQRCGQSVALLGAAESGGFPFAAIGCPGRNNGQGMVDIHFFCPILCLPPFEPGWNLAVSLDGEGSGGGPGTSRFGRSVSLSALNSVWLAAGAPRFGAGNGGRVWMYRMGDTVDDWTAEETYDGTNSGRFGFSVHLRDNVLVAGAPRRSVTRPSDNASIPVGSFSIATASCPLPPPAPCFWNPAQEYAGRWSSPGATSPQNRLGHAVHVLVTGVVSRVIAGEPDFGFSTRRGRVHHRRRDLNNGADWVLNLNEPFYVNSPPMPNDAALGNSLAGDNSWLAIGAPGHSDPEAGPRGRVFVYAYNNDLFNDRFEHPPPP